MNQASGVKTKTYRSPLREAQAKATRLNIIDRAAALFVERGYGATSIEAIAEAAGVGRATVFTSVGGKAAVLKAAYDVAIVGDDEPVPLPQRPWAQAVLHATTQAERIARYADVITLVSGRVAAIYEVFRAAAGTDPDVRTLWEELRAERRGGRGELRRVHHRSRSAAARPRSAERRRHRLDPQRPGALPPAGPATALVAGEVPGLDRRDDERPTAPHARR